MTRVVVLVTVVLGLARPAVAEDDDSRGLDVLRETLLGAATGAAGLGAGYLVGRVAFEPNTSVDGSDDDDGLGVAVSAYTGLLVGTPIGVLLAGPGYEGSVFPAYFGAVLGVLAGGVGLAIFEDGPLAYACVFGMPLVGSVATYNWALPRAPVAPVVRTSAGTTFVGLAGSF